MLTINDDAVAIKEIEWAIVERAWEEGWITPQPAARAHGPLRRHRRLGAGRPRRGSATRARGPRGDRVRARRPPRRAAALRHPRLQAREEPDRPPGRATRGRGRRVRARRLRRRRRRRSTSCATRHDALVLATGAQRHRALTLPGAELAGVHLAMEYLVQQNRRVAGLPVTAPELSAKGLRVAILGGGDTSADCLGNVLREGCASVVEIAHGPTPPNERTPQRTWPEWPFLLRTYPAHEEGGEREWQLETYAIEGDAGRVQRLRARRVEFPGFAETGVRSRSRSRTARSRSTSISCSSRSGSRASRATTRSTVSSAWSSERAPPCRSTPASRRRCRRVRRRRLRARSRSDRPGDRRRPRGGAQRRPRAAGRERAAEPRRRLGRLACPSGDSRRSPAQPARAPARAAGALRLLVHAAARHVRHPGLATARGRRSTARPTTAATARRSCCATRRGTPCC